MKASARSSSGGSVSKIEAALSIARSEYVTVKDIALFS